MPMPRIRAVTFAAPAFARQMSAAELSLIIIIRLAMFRIDTARPGGSNSGVMSPLPRC